MAASNYYGYTSGGQHSQAFTQVQNPSIQSTYGTPQSSSGYAVPAAAPTAGHYVPQQSQAPRQVVQPSGYSATGSTAYGQNSQAQGGAYGYTARQQDAPPPPPPSNTSFQTSHGSYQHHGTAQGYYEREAYDSKGSYYSSQPSSTVQTGQSGYYAQGASGAAKTAYPSSGAPAYSSAVSAAPVIAKSHPQAAYTSQSSTVAYPYSSARTQSGAYNHGGSFSSSNFGGPSSSNAAYHTQAYESVVYNAAQAYVHQQHQHQPVRNQGWKNNKPGGMGGGAGPRGQMKPKPPPKQPQIHYCDVCKISCAGPQTYKEHLEGQKHKKKEAAAKQKERESLPANAYRCELCDVTCTGADAYAAHLKGSKHQKVVKLHQKLGKPIPETPPPKPAVPKEAKENEDKGKLGMNRNAAKKGPVKKSPSAPKINFVGGTRLTLQGGVAKSEPATQGASPTTPTPTTPTQDEEMMDEDEEKFDMANFAGVDKSKLIVGTEYLEEIKNEEGKVVSFHCRLCECKFNDPNAKEAHLAGRRHRLQFKKKVQPDLVVETKPSNRRTPKGQEDKMRRHWEQEQLWHWRREQEQRWHENEMRRWEEGEYYRRMEEERAWEEENRRRFEAEAFFEWGSGRMGGPLRGPPGPMQPGSAVEMPPPPRPRYDTPDDRLVMSKHSTVYPNEQELQAVQNIVSASEKALKLVSDLIAEQDNPQTPVESEQVEVKKEEVMVEVKKEEGVTEEKKEAMQEEKKETPTKEKAAPPRALKGVMRVGVLAKGLLLHERLDVNLVVLCHDKPTKSLLKRVVDNLPPLLAKVTDEKYELTMVPENAGLTISTLSDPKVVVTITLTSPVMREGMDTANAAEDPEVMDRQKCLDALASLRHAKWFQAKANGLQSCVVIIRIMRDMCSRIPAFIPLNSWAMELLVEKALSSSSHPLGPGEAFRRVMECLSSGVLLEAGPGLSDPCEKESVDPTACMTAQEREDLTAAAQHALRLQAFRQLHKVLGVDPLPPPAKFRGRGLNRGGGRFKRRREDSGQGDEGAKKEKKEGEPGGEGEGEAAPASEGMEVAPGGEAKDAPGDKTEVKS